MENNENTPEPATNNTGQDPAVSNDLQQINVAGQACKYNNSKTANNIITNGIISQIADTKPKTIVTTQNQQPIKRKSNNPLGRPRILTDLDRVKKQVKEWMETDINLMTICGYARFLGFNCRKALLETIDRGDEISDVVKIGYNRVEEKYELKLCTQQYGGAIFALKNMGWRDIQETNNGVQINIVPKI